MKMYKHHSETKMCNMNCGTFQKGATTETKTTLIKMYKNIDIRGFGATFQ